MPADIEPFHAIAISRAAYALQAQGRSVLHMEFGQPSTGAPASALARAQAILAADPMGYWESDALKRRISDRYARIYGVPVDPERILLTCGASPALVAALTCGLDAGDRVAIARPGYVAYRNVCRALHLEPVEIACGAEANYRLTADRLDEVPDLRAVIIASPANPTGTITPADELDRIAAHCRSRGVTVISDEIYHGLSYGEPARSFLEFDDEAFVINSFSKYFSMPGWRLGWVVVPEAQVRRAGACVGNLFLTPPSLSQHAALAAFDDEAELDGHLTTYRRNRTLMLDALPRLGLGRIAPPDGAFYIYADVGHLTANSLAFCNRLLSDTGVAAAPGLDFDPVDGGRFVRFSFALSTPDLEEALARLTPWFAAQATIEESGRQGLARP